MDGGSSINRLNQQQQGKLTRRIHIAKTLTLLNDWKVLLPSTLLVLLPGTVILLPAVLSVFPKLLPSWMGKVERIWGYRDRALLRHRQRMGREIRERFKELVVADKEISEGQGKLLKALVSFCLCLCGVVWSQESWILLRVHVGMMTHCPQTLKCSASRTLPFPNGCTPSPTSTPSFKPPPTTKPYHGCVAHTSPCQSRASIPKRGCCSMRIGSLSRTMGWCVVKGCRWRLEGRGWG